MSSSLKDIQRPIADQMNDFEKRFRSSMKSNVMLLDKIFSYIVKRKGKQMRPMFVFLSAGINGEINDSTYRGASLIELLHTASLVHDDVVDDANYRRGFFSINALWKNKIAVLVGDFLYSRGMLLALENDDFELLKIVSNAVKEMSEGELMQIEKARKLDITDEIYFEIIKQKTASLIASCCKVGAASVGASQEIVNKFGEFGEKVGIAFQIKDDLFDYGALAIGKPVGIDIKERKMTLPLIYALRHADWQKKNSIRHIVRNESHKPKKVKEVIDYVKASGGIQYTQKIMDEYLESAIQILNSFPSSPYKEALHQLVQYTIQRTK